MILSQKCSSPAFPIILLVVFFMSFSFCKISCNNVLFLGCNEVEEVIKKAKTKQNKTKKTVVSTWYKKYACVLILGQHLFLKAISFGFKSFALRTDKPTYKYSVKFLYKMVAIIYHQCTFEMFVTTVQLHTCVGLK